MRNKKFTVGIIAFVMSLSLVGCGSASNGSSYTDSITSNSSISSLGSASDSSVFYEESYYEKEYSEPDKTVESEAESQIAQTNRKLIKTVDMNVETKEFDATITTIENKVTELGGYIEDLNTYNGSSYSSYRSARNAEMTIRIPKQKLDTFLETVEGVSNVVRKNESVEDVTLTYVDLESHQKVLQAERETLLTLMEKAEVIEDIITIEERLSEVIYELESMESQLRTFDNIIDYSTVYLSIDEVQELTPVAEQTPFERIVEGFIDNMKDIRDGFVEFAIWFVVTIPYFVLWSIVAIVVIVIIKIYKKRKKAKRIKMNEAAIAAASKTENK